MQNVRQPPGIISRLLDSSMEKGAERGDRSKHVISIIYLIEKRRGKGKKMLKRGKKKRRTEVGEGEA